MARGKTPKKAPMRASYVDDTILRNGFSYGNDIYIEYAFNLETRVFTAVVKNRREDFELTGAITMTEPAENGTETAENGTETAENGTETTEGGN